MRKTADATDGRHHTQPLVGAGLGVKGDFVMSSNTVIKISAETVSHMCKNFFVFFFLRRNFVLVTQTRVQWCDLDLLQTLPLRFK